MAARFDGSAGAGVGDTAATMSKAASKVEG